MGDHALHHEAEAHQEIAAQDATVQDTQTLATAAEQTAAQETAISLLVEDDHVAPPLHAPAEGELPEPPPPDGVASFSAAQALVGATQQASEALDRLVHSATPTTALLLIRSLPLLRRPWWLTTLPGRGWSSTRTAHAPAQPAGNQVRVCVCVCVYVCVSVCVCVCVCVDVC
jgi:hypothetical protein